MNILSLFGGPRKKGNTATILGWVEEELMVLGHQIERVFLSRMKVNGCLGCLNCEDIEDDPETELHKNYTVDRWGQCHNHCSQ